MKQEGNDERARQYVDTTKESTDNEAGMIREQELRT